LYDLGTHVQTSEHLAGLVRPLSLRVHPETLQKSGVTGERAMVTSARGGVEVAVTADDSVLPGTVLWPFNVNEEQNPAEYIDASQSVTTVRLEQA
jgi:anaerobic selenocysteine-containing dehydrogenase